jgi:maltooligosyltrehalose trehalohydrolase
VVYNHAGPTGNYLESFSPDYFTDRYSTDWGEALNFDGPNAGPVREFFVANAGYWIEEFHLDGLRLDATQNIYDASKVHILAEITAGARRAAGGRAIIVTAENEPQNVRLIQSVESGGYGMDALWNDDFHHSAMVALSHNEAIIPTSRYATGVCLCSEAGLFVPRAVLFLAAAAPRDLDGRFEAGCVHPFSGKS